MFLEHSNPNSGRDVLFSKCYNLYQTHNFYSKSNIKLLVRQNYSFWRRTRKRRGYLTQSTNQFVFNVLLIIMFGNQKPWTPALKVSRGGGVLRYAVVQADRTNPLWTLWAAGANEINFPGRNLHSDPRFKMFIKHMRNAIKKKKCPLATRQPPSMDPSFPFAGLDRDSKNKNP